MNINELFGGAEIHKTKGALRYVEGAQFLKQLIISKNLKKGTKLPSVRNLSQKLGLSMMTTLKILDHLEKEGLVCRIHGKGTFLNREEKGSYRILFMLDHLFYRTSYDHYLHDIFAASQNWFTQRCHYFSAMALNKSMEIPMDAGMVLGTPRPAGLILGVNLEQKWVNLADSTGLPAIGFNRLFPNHPKISSILQDDNLGAILIARHLWELRHRDVIVLRPQLPGKNLHVEKVNSLREFWAEHQAENHLKIFDIDHSKDVDSQYERILGKLFKPSNRNMPTAIIGFSDYAAAGAYKFIKKSGLNIPRDVSVTGFLDLALASQLEPKLTTVCVYPDQIGKVISEHLNAIITGIEERGKIFRTPVKLIIRNSTAIARKNR